MITFLNRLKVSEFGNVLLKFASAQVVSNFLKIISGFLVVRSIDPESYGLFTGVGVYMGYILLGHGGIINGLSRELPYELGRGNDREAKYMASSVFVLTSLVSLLASLAFLGVSLTYFIKGDLIIGILFLGYSLMGGLHMLNRQFLPVLYRTNKDFNSLSKQNILIGISNLFSVLLVWQFGIYGLIARGILLAIFEFYLLFKSKPYSLNFSYNTKHLKKLLFTGLPIFMVGQVNPLWATVINNIIFSLGGPVSYGLYAISNIIQSAVGVIPNAFSQIIYPRMAIMLGEGKTIKSILNRNIKPLLFQCILLLIVGILGAIILPYLIPILLPQYIGGIKAAQWMLFVPFVQSFGALNNIYNVAKKQLVYFISLAIGAILGSAYIIINLQVSEFDLVYFPQGLIIGKAIQQILALGFLRYLINNE